MGRMTKKERERINAYIQLSPTKIVFDDLIIKTLGTSVAFFPINEKTVKIRGQSPAPFQIDGNELKNERLCAKLIEYVGHLPEVHKSGDNEVTMYRREEG